MITGGFSLTRSVCESLVAEGRRGGGEKDKQLFFCLETKRRRGCGHESHDPVASGARVPALKQKLNGWLNGDECVWGQARRQSSRVREPKAKG